MCAVQDVMHTEISGLFCSSLLNYFPFTYMFTASLLTHSQKVHHCFIHMCARALTRQVTFTQQHFFATHPSHCDRTALRGSLEFSVLYKDLGLPLQTGWTGDQQPICWFVENPLCLLGHIKQVSANGINLWPVWVYDLWLLDNETDTLLQKNLIFSFHFIKTIFKAFIFFPCSMSTVWSWTMEDFFSCPIRMNTSLWWATISPSLYLIIAMYSPLIFFSEPSLIAVIGKSSVDKTLSQNQDLANIRISYFSLPLDRLTFVTGIHQSYIQVK